MKVRAQARIDIPTGAPVQLGAGHLDRYLAAVARALRAHGVITGSPLRTDPAQRLLGSIVLDCTAVRVAARRPGPDLPAGEQSLGGAIHPGGPAPVIVTWDEDSGWCVGLHHDPTHSSRRYLHPDLLPVPSTVADFVVGLALGRSLGAAYPVDVPTPGRPPLHLVAPLTELGSAPGTASAVGRTTPPSPLRG